MAEVVPFRGIVYNTSKVSGGDVVAPPYDIITSEIRQALYAKSPYNVVRIDSGQELSADNERENKYVRAARLLEQWQLEGILTAAPRPCFYAYEMDYEAEGWRKRLQGFFGLVRVVELGQGVYPHEETHSKPKVDRLSLTTACEANTSPIFSLYNSPEKRASTLLAEITKARPYTEAVDPNGSMHRLWIMDKEGDIQMIRQELKGKAVYIADGHHRYETALEYQKIMLGKSGAGADNEAFNYVLMFLANIADGDITILPTHRIIRYTQGDIVRRLSDYFDIKTIDRDDDIIALMRGAVQTCGLYQKGDAKQYILRYRGEGLGEIHPALRSIDATILHEMIFKNLLHVSDIRYEMDPAIARGLVDRGDSDAVFFLNPTRVGDVERVALSSMRMPPKSTYFYPKVMTGFVINSFKNTL